MEPLEIEGPGLFYSSQKFDLIKWDFDVSLVEDDTEIIHNHDGKLGYKLVVENVDTAGMVNFHIKPLHDVPNIFAK